MADGELASLAEIIAAAEEGGIPVVSGGQLVNNASAEKVDVEPPEFTGPFQRAPIDTPGNIQFPSAYATPDPVQEGTPITSIASGFCSCPPIGDGISTFSRDCGILRHRVLATEGRDILKAGRSWPHHPECAARESQSTPCNCPDAPYTNYTPLHRDTDAEPTKQREGDQVLPTASRDLPVAHEQVISDLQERLRLGVERYGQRLRPFNGRNTLQDEYEELLDQIAYKKTQLLMREATREVLIQQAAEVIDQMITRKILRGATAFGVAREIAEKVVDKILDCFTGQEAQG